MNAPSVTEATVTAAVSAYCQLLDKHDAAFRYTAALVASGSTIVDAVASAGGVS